MGSRGFGGRKRLYEEEITRNATMIHDLEGITLLEEVSWRQKLRLLWLREGDKCIMSFH